MSPELKKHVGRFWSVDNVTCFEIEDERRTQLSYFPSEEPNAFWKKDFERLVGVAAKHYNITREEILNKLDAGETIGW